MILLTFVFRLLNQYEFEELTHALHRICKLIERTERIKTTVIELSLIKRFHEELNLFLSYKCLIFISDFYHEFIDDNRLHSFIKVYQPVFESIKR